MGGAEERILSNAMAVGMLGVAALKHHRIKFMVLGIVWVLEALRSALVDTIEHSACCGCVMSCPCAESCFGADWKVCLMTAAPPALVRVMVLGSRASSPLLYWSAAIATCGG